jgi:hypothetical protein
MIDEVTGRWFERAANEPTLWITVDLVARTAVACYPTKGQAEVNAERLRRWFNRTIEVQEL